MNSNITTSSLLRLIGVMAMGVGAAWALQVLGLGGSSAAGRMVWVLSAATIAGVGAGLVYTSASIAIGKDGSAKA